MREPIDGLANAFQSTLPLRGATSGLIRARNADGISIHTPLAGSDSPSQDSISDQREFQSTLPLRGATLQPCGTLIFK